MAKEIVFTEDQLNAVNSRGGTLFVSAAAGSGKTAVLTERVVKLLCDENENVSPDELLIVTFTRAAAAEMREKIAAALRREAAKTGNVRLKRQLLLLPSADICTMDAFCSKIVRENFHLACVTPDFRMLSEHEEEILKESAVNAVLEELYQSKEQDLTALTDLFSGEKGDGQLSDAILSLYKYSQSYPFPEKWLLSVGEMYSPDLPLSDSVWGKTVLEYIGQSVDYAISLEESALGLASEDSGLYDNYAPAILNDLKQLNGLKILADKGDWDGVVDALCGFGIISLGSGARGANKELRAAAKSGRDEAVKTIKELWNFQLPSLEVHREDVLAMKNAVELLINSVIKFSEKLDGLKRGENSYGFSDILHMSISLLVNSEGGKTPLSESLCKKYKEILIDEYQDTNEAQDMLFYSVSKDGNNLFFVGDVKQSIYGFRLAMPEIFLRKKESLPLFDGVVFPSQIMLDRNFRSRKAVCEFVNHIFSRIMSEQTGELSYGAGERLVPAADYPDSSANEAELIILDAPDGVNTADSRRLEAEYVADYIENIVKSGYEITEKDKTRPVRYGDFCVLLRAVRSVAPAYYAALKKRGIPVASPTDSQFFSTREISFVHSLLRALDNPLLDVPLAAALMFPVFGFTADDLAGMRIIRREEPLFTGLSALARDGDKKAGAFLEQFTRMRNEASRLTVTELLFYLYDETGIMSVVSAMDHASERRRNLLAFLNLAKEYTNGRESSVSGFTRFLNKARLSGKSVESSSGADFSEHEVKIMSVHKSKGLEFPVVILAGCANKFNTAYERANLLIDRKTGIGMPRRDIPTLSKYRTVPFTAARLSVERTEKAEELRLLYVAMTRAKEKLVMVCSKPEKSDFSFTDNMVDGKGEAYPFAIRKARSFYEWLVCAILNHPDAQILRTPNVNRLIQTQKSEFKLSVMTGRLEEKEITEKKTERISTPDRGLEKLISERISYVYPYISLKSVSAKRTASSLAGEAAAQHFANSKPSFVSGAPDAAARGTAVHKFLELCDFKAASQNAKKEAKRLLESGALNENEYGLIDFSKVEDFFGSLLGQRLVSSDKILREYKFSVFRRAGELYGELESGFADEPVVVEGVVDCAFYEGGEIVLIDYKTDRTKDINTLKRRYENQLGAYKNALSQCEGRPVKEAYIYSLYLSDFIKV